MCRRLLEGHLDHDDIASDFSILRVALSAHAR
jgi:hypothetical protein